MPSPFPGMDPYLERPNLFPGFHADFLSCLKQRVNAQLPKPYFALSGERVWVELSDRHIEPDLGLHKGMNGQRQAGESTAGVAVLTPPIRISVPEFDMHQQFLEVYFQSEDGRRRLVTVIEMLSPSNKTPGEHGRELYRRKQREVLESATHLLEIDLLRGGQHTTGVPLARLQQRVPRWDYHICCHRFDEGQEFLIYPIVLESPLPKIQLPLLEPEQGVEIDLQKVMDQAYDIGAYPRIVRYGVDPIVPPLSPEQAAWWEDRRRAPAAS